MTVLSYTFRFPFVALLFFQAGVLQGQELPAALPTYSICFEKSTDVSQRSPHLIQLLEFHELDILGPNKGIFTENEEALTETGYVSLSKESTKSTGIFYNPEKFELLDHSHFSIQPLDTSSETDLKQDHPHCVWGKLRNLEDGRLLYVFNVNVDVATGRQEPMSKLKRLILQEIQLINMEGLPYILTGGFGSEESIIPGINAIELSPAPES
jgi:hypothetical protein